MLQTRKYSPALDRLDSGFSDTPRKLLRLIMGTSTVRVHFFEAKMPLVSHNPTLGNDISLSILYISEMFELVLKAAIIL